MKTCDNCDGPLSSDSLKCRACDKITTRGRVLYMVALAIAVPFAIAFGACFFVVVTTVAGS